MVNIPLGGLKRVHVVCAPRHRTLVGIIAFTFFIIVSSIIVSSLSTNLPREYLLEKELVEITGHLELLESLYRARQEEVLILQAKLSRSEGLHRTAQTHNATEPTLSPEVAALVKNLNNTKLSSGLHPKPVSVLGSSFVWQLMPHLMDNPSALTPAYHLKGPKTFTDIVIGIPTVKRDKESYLLITLKHLVDGMGEEYMNATLIVVLVGETDLDYVTNTARQIEARFPKEVSSGLIEVLSPPASFYPNFDKLKPNLGDSMKRMKWRTKQNLDTLYLMSYARTKGSFYLMLEDDVVAKSMYMQEIKAFTVQTSMTNPDWFFIEFCHVGGIGKLFRSSGLPHFITYVQLFYTNMPIDWLLESYLANRICPIDKNSKECGKQKLLIRPKYKSSLFQHIGLYSSLKGKIQKIKDSKFGAVPLFYPHKNPPLETVKVDITEHGTNTARRAYEGQTFLWAEKPTKGQVIEFWFEKPTNIKRYLFRSGNVEHVSDKFYHTAIEVLPSDGGNFTMVGSFDEFGLADGEIKGFGPLIAIRLRIQQSSGFWAILSEIELKTYAQDLLS